MKKENVGLLIKGIKCDTKKCNYEDSSVTFEDYPKWVNKPCPKCGGNLLSEADYLNCKLLISLTESLGGNFYDEEDHIPNRENKKCSLKMKMDGSGEIKIIGDKS